MYWKMFNDEEIFGRKPALDRKFRDRISPYLIPQAYRIYVNKIDSSINLEFKYISDDLDFVTITVSKNVNIFYGKQSNRIFKISVMMNNIYSEDELLDYLKQTQKFLAEIKSKEKKSRENIDSNLFKLRIEDLLHEPK